MLQQARIDSNLHVCSNVSANMSVQENNLVTVTDLLAKGNLAFYGYRASVLPDFVNEKEQGSVQVYTKKNIFSKIHQEGITVSEEGNLLEMRERQVDILFLDRKSTKILLAQFPITPQYVLVRLIPRRQWLVALPGLLRRLFVGLVKIKGVHVTHCKGRKQRWLVLEHLLSKSLQTRYSISEEVGVQGLIDYLRAEKVRYVILRFYEKLPELHRAGGDLDVLVADEDEHKIRQFLQKHPGKLSIDVWTPSRAGHNSVTYYPPHLARAIIASAVDGPAGAKVPASKEAFLSFAYHVLYHKGHLAGVPTEVFGLKLNKVPENDYYGEVQKMIARQQLNIGDTMESLDEYLAEEGWRPKTDTLAKIAPWNTWVEKRFFANTQTSEIGLGVIIIKQKAVDSGVSEKMLRMIAEHSDFRVLETKHLNAEEVKHATRQLRGGVWDDISGAVTDFLPAIVVVVLDTKLAKLAKILVQHKEIQHGIRALKSALRKEFDHGSASLVHATDFTYEAWEYIDECFAREREKMQQKIELAYDAVMLSILEKLKLYIGNAPRRIVRSVKRTHNDILGAIVRYLMR